ncbi:uncharacterized protein LOC114525591 [Dendronephthya gigantea]|uniref:uncharacterized protein LOC114525591 n=1 Tax=Dendronephthya gigantea TaxID=151771 RepID=UPI00106CCDF1|nr:uncharacterized protein LOC114525591 [Dendronephthya gigantea]
MLSNVLLLHFLLHVTPYVALAGPCEDIGGNWMSKLGAKLEITHSANGVLSGKYYKPTDSSRGDSGAHEIVGTLPYNKPGASFAFSVNWQNGSSTTVWTGQCLMCDGKESLETSWLLKSYVHSCIDKWKSTQIGKDVFERKPTSVRTSKENSKSTPGEFTGRKCNLNGTWYNDLGSEIILNQTENGIIKGEFRTAVERKKGSAGKSHSLVYGFGTYGKPNTTFSLVVIWRSGASVTGWVGECHFCTNNTAMLQMNWLLRSKVDNCNDVWRSTYYGENTFTRHEQKPGPRKSLGTHTPNRDGEDADEDIGGSSSLMLSNILFVAVLLSMWIAK